MPEFVEVIKQDIEGNETWKYTAQVLRVNPDSIQLEAHFDRWDTPVDGIVLRKGDRFLETYFFQRWYNYYEIHDREDDHLKGYYCNVGYPAHYSNQKVSYRDLALDLLVYPDGRQKVLDQDEFEALPLSEEVRQKALRALDELKGLFASS